MQLELRSLQFTLISNSKVEANKRVGKILENTAKSNRLQKNKTFNCLHIENKYD